MHHLGRLAWIYLALMHMFFVTLSLSCSSVTKEAEPLRAVALVEELTAEEQQRLNELRAEMEIGRNMVGRLLQFYGTFEDPQWVRYVNEVGSLIASHSDYPERRFMFDILNVEQPNAFAAPGGYILITRGALEMARTEAELAAIIAHEIAHVGLEHMINELTKMDAQELNEMADRLEQQSLPAEVLVRKRPDPPESQTGELLARYLTGNVGGLNILQAARAGMSIILEEGLGAELELEADRKGLEFLVNAGYHPYALIDYLCRIETSRSGDEKTCTSKKAESRKETVLDRTHPPIPQRIANMQALLDEWDAKSIVGARGERRYLHYHSRFSHTPD